MTYRQKLQDPRWQKKRLEILARDSFTCQLCSDKENTLHIHHKTYKQNTDPWDYEDDNFVTLCKYCHSEVEQAKIDEEKILAISRLPYKDFSGTCVAKIYVNSDDVKVISFTDNKGNTIGISEKTFKSLGQLFDLCSPLIS